MANPFVHIELMTGDVDKAEEFHGALFDGQLEDVSEMNCTIVKVGEGTGGRTLRHSGSLTSTSRTTWRGSPWPGRRAPP
jgi:predicted enzyme related to lactoylglutathione lyase